MAPPGAAQPLPTPTIDVLLNLEIVSGDRGDSGYFLQSNSTNTSYLGDTWHESLEEAIDLARFQFGIEPGEWEVVLE